MKLRFLGCLGWACALASTVAVGARGETVATVSVQADAAGTKISPDLIGIFFEDINYAADGGLYAELVQNRSFEYNATESKGWNALTAWELVERGGGKGTVTTETTTPVHSNNPHYAVVKVEQAGEGVGLANSGFDGVVLKQGENYNLTLFARQTAGQELSLTARLESKTGTVYGEFSLGKLSKDWAKYSATIPASATDADARLVILAGGVGTFCLDTVSLFPEKTFHHRPNGMRADLAQAIADLHPKFVRFPGGCLAHGYGLSNIYRWKDTVGPIEQRKEQRNIWRYHQSVGLGYFEYFQFCEDIGAKPLPVLAAGVCCQNSPGGQHGIPMSQMKAYVQDVLDLVEYANGPKSSTWGAKRAAAGHPEPFHLRYLGVGNEDQQTPEFGIRFKMIYDAVKAKYPGITVVGTVGPASAGTDFSEGWKFARELKVDMVDEHYYEKPEWFLTNLHRYDTYSRAGTKVYLGEYASWGNSVFNAMAEAAYLTTLERNGDVVRMASYAPLLGREHHMQWRPNLIYFNNTELCRSVNYYVQQLFGQNQGDTWLPTDVSLPQPGSKSNGFLLGAWDTQVQYKDLKVVSGDKTLLEEPLTSEANHWTPSYGNWGVIGGAYVQSADGQPTLSFLTPRVEQASYTLTLKAKKTSGQEGFLIGFAVRDARSYYWWNLGGWDNTQHALEKTVNGAKTTLSERVDGSIELNRWYDIKVVVASGHIKCYLDGVLLHDVVDNAGSGSAKVMASCVKDSKTGDTILKLVNVTAETVKSQVNLDGIGAIKPVAARTILAGDPKAEDTLSNPSAVLPKTDEIQVGSSFTTSLPPHSLTVIRINNR
jgi:alpha-L-arabinofuranosidase